MLSNYIVSIIIPVWNAEHTIEKCLYSVIDQTYRNLDIILIDDGSTDGTQKIINKFIDLDPRITLVLQSNQGVSSARNRGLGLAIGEYITFVDSDDWIERDYIECLLFEITTRMGDCVICNVEVHNNGSSEGSRLKLGEDLIYYPAEQSEFFRHLMRFRFDYSNWNKLYNAKIIRECEIRFNIYMSAWEDILFNLQFFLNSYKVTCIDKSLYHYTVNGDGLTKRGSQPKRLILNVNQLFNDFSEFCSDLGKNKELEIFQFEINRIVNYQIIEHAKSSVVNNYTSVTEQFLELRHLLKLIDRKIFKLSAVKFNLLGIKNFLMYFGAVDIVVLLLVLKRSRKIN